MSWFPGHGWIMTQVTDRVGLTTTLPGPLIVQEYDATCLIPPGARAQLDDFGNIGIDLHGA
jgi:N-methylhydantoinase A